MREFFNYHSVSLDLQLLVVQLKMYRYAIHRLITLLIKGIIPKDYYATPGFRELSLIIFNSSGFIIWTKLNEGFSLSPFMPVAIKSN